MKLNQMRAFTELMLTGSVTEAAKNLHRTQPSISSLIASLEDDLGIKLFERRNTRLFPVPEAHYLFEECREMLTRMENVGEHMRRIKSLESGQLKVASMPGPSVFLIPDLISRHVKEHPDIESTMVSRSSDAVYQLIGAQQYDLGIADYDNRDDHNNALINTEVFHFDCLCALPMGDPLSKKSIITAKDLDEKKLAILYSEHSNHQKIEQAFVASGSKMSPHFMTQNFIPLLSFVEKGIACAIVDRVTARSYQIYKQNEPKIAFKRFEPKVQFSIAVITPTHRPLSVLAKHFAEEVKNEFRQLSDFDWL